jgi:hypothetical protein
MKKLKVGENTKQKEQFEQDIKLKIDSFKKLVEYISEFNENVELREVYQRPFEYAIELTTCNHKPEFKKVIIEKVFELIGFSVSKLQELCTPFEKVEHTFNPLTFEYETPDFNIYITTPEQHLRNDSSRAICEAVDQLIKEGTPLHKGSIIQGFRGIVVPDYANNKIQPNINYIIDGAKSLYRGM